MTMPSIAEQLRQATGLLSACSESPRLDAEVLLSTVLGRPRSALLVHGEELLEDARRLEFEHLLGERRRGMPVAYLTGTREFWSLPLRVTPSVLVPRPETELLVELVLARLPAQRNMRVLDLGTGSGAIALAIASERPRALVTGTDVCADALEVAAQNARALGLCNLQWLPGSWFDAVGRRRYDVIVSNPPYVAAGDPALAALRAEPMLALSPGPTGMEACVQIVSGAAAHLADDGLLALEHGSGQAEALAALLGAHGFREISSHCDGAGHARVMLAAFHPTTQEPS